MALLTLHGRCYLILYRYISYFCIHLEKKRERDENRELLHYLQSSITRPVSIIVPAYNEGVTIVSSVQSLLTLEYPEFEVIVVNDGSSDDTLEQLKDHFQLYEIQNVVRLQLETETIRKHIAHLLINKLLLSIKKTAAKRML